MADYEASPPGRRPLQAEPFRAQIQAAEVDLHAGLNGVAGILADAREMSEILRQGS